MSKIVKSVFVILIALWSCQSFAQNWHTLYANQFHPFFYWISYPAKQFRISPYDNSIWLIRDTTVFHFDGDGQYAMYNTVNVPMLNNTYLLNDIAITPTRVVFSDEYYGLYTYNGSTWSTISGGVGAVSLAADYDTVYCARINQPLLINDPWSTQFANTNIRRLASNDGDLWGINSFGAGYMKRYDQNMNFKFYNADTIPYLLDNQHYYFGFSKNTNDFYTSGDKGLSIANNGVFYDTLTPFNTINMPALPIMEFEFDKNDNIWVVFGAFSGLYLQAQKIGFYDRSINTWTTFYDNTNSPITIPGGGAGLELDTLGNLWVVNDAKLHMLALNSTPQWLNVKENELKSKKVAIYPNPTKGDISIEFNFATSPALIEIFDLTGNKVQEMAHTNHLNLNLLPGMYYLKITDIFGDVFSEKVILK